MSYVHDNHAAPPEATPPTARSATPLVAGIAALALGAVGYLALGMPGMDHSAAGTDDAIVAHMGHRLLDPSAFEAAVADPDVVLINVHVPASEIELDGTDITMAFDQIDVARLPVDRSVPIAVYCRSGAMSAKAVEELLALNYDDVSELAGGTEAWAASGRELASAADD
jgi:rhodanese-related sulfurtransferase